MTDPNVWIRAAVRPYGYEYYEMLIVYVDDLMIVFHLGDDLDRQIGNFYRIN